MPTNLDYVAMGIVAAAVATLYFATRLTLEILVATGYRHLLEDVRQAEARMREWEAAERAARFLRPRNRAR